MSKKYTIRKGLNLPLIGDPIKEIKPFKFVSNYAVRPSEFIGIKPKLAVKVGDEVKAGQTILFDKKNERIKIPSPISGEISAIQRGPKRRLDQIVIRANEKCEYLNFGSKNIIEKDEIKTRLLESGAWSLLKMRPYGCLANPDDSPKAIFINGMGSDPFASKPGFSLKGKEGLFRQGLEVLRKLSDRTILSIAQDEKSDSLTNIDEIEIHRFSGPHPAGNTSVHISRVLPLNKGEVIWTIAAQDVAIIGKLFESGELHLDRTIAAGGSGMKNPQYYEVRGGQSMKTFFSEETNKGNYRYISGSVLSGEDIGKEGYLGFLAKQVSVIPEGEKTDFLGWVLPGFNKYSFSKAYFSWLFPNRKYDLTTKLNGEERAFVVTGQYDKVFPFDILPNQLLKSIWAEDIEKMEELGIYEIIPEDFALCEVICTSKQPLQEMVRKGLDILYNEMN
tara:strand:+ start:1014 stop:2354 length:1341 start_codon:yes stop_codon:yes gene_type:complete